MGDELIERHREYGKPPSSCDSRKREDGTVVLSTPVEADCLADFSELAFFVEPKEKPKLKTTWRK